MPLVEVSFGELMDKYSILEVKSENLTDSSQRATVNKEILSLTPDVQRALENTSVARIALELKEVNLEIWRLMDALYSLDAPGAEYAELTWEITIQNQKRAFLKKGIDLEMKSTFSEEKSFFSQPNQRIV
jgi:hypothetical protein